jgi:hypothetical protein
MADGSVTFITENIDVGNTSFDFTTIVGELSPYGVFGALGTRSSSENVTPGTF